MVTKTLNTQTHEAELTNFTAMHCEDEKQTECKNLSTSHLSKDCCANYSEQTANRQQT